MQQEQGRRQTYGSPRSKQFNTYGGNQQSNYDPLGGGQNYNQQQQMQSQQMQQSQSYDQKFQSSGQKRKQGNQRIQQRQQQQQQRPLSSASAPGTDPVVWVRSILARDPFSEPTKATQWSTYFLMTIVQSMGVSPESGYQLMGPNFAELGSMLQRGVPNSGFFLVRRLCQTMYHGTAHMLRLFEEDIQNNLAVLNAFRTGIASEDRETSVMSMHIFRNMAHRNSNNMLAENFWSWFVNGEGGLSAVSASIVRHNDDSTRKAAVEMIGHMCPSQSHASRLFSQVLLTAFPKTADYLLIVHDLLQFFQLQNSQMAQHTERSTMITLGTVRHIVKYAFMWAQSRQSTPVEGSTARRGAGQPPVDERSRCAALSLLAELWLLMDVSVTDGDEKKRAEVMKAILGLLKRAARETQSATVKITANACLFVLLEAFVQNQRPYAP